MFTEVEWCSLQSVIVPLPHFHYEVQCWHFSGPSPGKDRTAAAPPREPDYPRFRKDSSRSMAGPRRNPGAGGTRIAAARSFAPPGRGRRPDLAIRSGSGGSLSVCCGMATDFFRRLSGPDPLSRGRTGKDGQRNVRRLPAPASFDARHAPGGARMPPPRSRPARIPRDRPFRLPDAGPAVFLLKIPSLLRSGARARGGGIPLMRPPSVKPLSS